MIRLSYPDIRNEVIAEIRKVIETGMLIGGENVRKFEEKTRAYVGSGKAVAVSSGTAALHIALMAAGIKKGDDVIVADFTFPSPANMVEAVGAKPVLADIDKETFNISLPEIESKITEKTKAIIAVDQFGHPAEMREIMAIAGKKGITVIEDAACALGAEYKGKKCGSFGIGCISYHPRKIIATGDGGMITCNSAEFAEKCSQLRNHGIKQKEGKRLIEEIGYNYRMGEINAALGLEQMGRVEEIISKRRSLARLMTEDAERIKGVTPPTEKNGCRHVYQSYVILLDKGINRDRAIEKLKSEGIEATQGTDAVHMQPYYMKKYGYKEGDLKNSAEAERQSIALPMHAKLTEKDIHQITSSLAKAVKN